MANMRSRWDDLSLVRQFALSACSVVGAGTVVLGSFVSAEIEAHVVRNSAAATASYINSLDRSYLQELTPQSTLSEEQLRALDNLFKDAELARQIVSVKICLPDRRIVYSTSRDFIGKTFPVNPKLLKALTGKVAARFGSPKGEADAVESGLQVPLLEIYVPIHEKGGDNIVAVGQPFSAAPRLQPQPDASPLHSA